MISSPLARQSRRALFYLSGQPAALDSFLPHICAPYREQLVDKHVVAPSRPVCLIGAHPAP